MPISEKNALKAAVQATSKLLSEAEPAPMRSNETPAQRIARLKREAELDELLTSEGPPPKVTR